MAILFTFLVVCTHLVLHKRLFHETREEPRSGCAYIYTRMVQVRSLVPRRPRPGPPGEGASGALI